MTEKRSPEHGPAAEEERREEQSTGEATSPEPEQEKEKEKEKERRESVPVLPLKSTVLFPGMLVPLAVGRPRSVAAVKAALESEEKEIILVAQRDASVDEPRQKDLFTIGTRAVLKHVTRTPNGPLQVMAQGLERVVLVRFDQEQPFLRAVVRPRPVEQVGGAEIEALEREVKELMARIVSLTMADVPIDLDKLQEEDHDPLRLAYMFASMLGLDTEKEQAILEAESDVDSLRLLHRYLSHEVKVAELRSEIAKQADTKMSREQREYLLRQQLRAIQEELGESGSEQAEIEELRNRADEAALPEDVRKEFDRELKRLSSLPSAAPDYNVTRTYLEFILELPWNSVSEDTLDLEHVRRILDEDHYGLEEIKQRILEHLSVLALNPDAKAPILCFVGPPGVGKTSLGQSIARAMGRKFERLSLGGMHDEAELRGHRRTYIGAMPGRVLQAIRRAGTRNPLLMLDEVDKLGRDFRGDPAAALLEILDPEQNRSFRDNYLELPFDLSRVFFITTANTLDTVPLPLLDRMEVIQLSGYSELEKTEIARRYLIPRQLANAGIDAERCRIDDEALRATISRYTREAGVRQLDRAIGKIARKVAYSIVHDGVSAVIIDRGKLSEMLGPEKFFIESVRKHLPPGVAAGLAWTPSGGDVLYVEATMLPEGSGLTLTGQLGDVMQESAKTALSYLWSHARQLHVDPKLFKENGIHIHVPAGATPKDGPSAGITMATALASLYTGRPVRDDTAMTGEITLSGLVLPVGGIKEKALAAHRAGLARIILSKENRKDVADLPDYVREDLDFVHVETIEEVLDLALEDYRDRPALGQAG